jgi:pimeloyl-ACP methyl ester carboxylesterase
MKINVNGHTTFCYTGGKTYDGTQPTLVFVHGALNDHSVWILQTRYMAHHGWNVLAPDLPGHGKSAGDPPLTVEAAADFVLALIDAAGLERVAIVGHSFGSLIALEVAGRAPERIRHLVLAGTAFPMKVSAALLSMSLNAPLKAIDMVNVFSHSTLAPPPSALGPGSWLYGGSRALMLRVLASNPTVNLFHAGFKACDDYTHGAAAMRQVTAPTLFILGQRDQMTPAKAAQLLVDHAANSKVVVLDAGHQMMLEAPDGVLFAIRDFLAAG